jgi:hypothetical protein
MAVVMMSYEKSGEAKRVTFMVSVTVVSGVM